MSPYYKAPLATATIIFSVSFFILINYDLGLLYPYLISLNLSAISLMLIDKVSSGIRTSRIPENLLLAISAAGASPGVLISTQLFRHKSAKSSFLIGHVLIFILQISLLLALTDVLDLSY